ncbi:hypothetical protein IKH83_03730 [Candidatus Saccharibacteria bacterium]|nr:hypothetical protein [Candidatus Saccharibacteria bacterium]
MENERAGLADNSAWDSLKDVKFAALDTEHSAEKTKEQVIDMTTAPEGILASDFKSGTYLFHSATVDGIKGILESGEILNAEEIYERRIAARREELVAEGKNEEEIATELKKVMVRHNSGQEGISWSTNGIDAMPGTRGRIAGFVAAPELVLGDDKLVIPSRPAPYELLQVSGNIDTKEFFKTKKQHEVWGCREFSIGETAAVESGLMRFSMNIDHGDEADEYGFYRSRLREFCDRGGLPADELRKHFELSEDGHIKLDEDLHQQQFDENYLPPAAVFIQALNDRGDFKGLPLEGKSVAEVLDACKENKKILSAMFGLARQESERYSDAYEAELGKAKGVSAKVEDMYFVTSHKDLDEWMDVIKKSGHMPRGILLYDDEKIVKENFASDEKGDHEEMTAEIGRVVGADKEFWSAKMGMDIANIARAGSKGQVLKDSEVDHDIEVKMVNGELGISKI